jgi:hypothetical protein
MKISGNQASRAWHATRAWNAIPQHCPVALKTGPPLLPPLMAASICATTSSGTLCDDLRVQRAAR